MTTLPPRQFGAEKETRTPDPDLGKVVLYQLSYFRVNTELMSPVWLLAALQGRSFYGLPPNSQHKCLLLLITNHRCLYQASLKSQMLSS